MQDHNSFKNSFKRQLICSTVKLRLVSCSTCLCRVSVGVTGLQCVSERPGRLQNVIIINIDHCDYQSNTVTGKDLARIEYDMRFIALLELDMFC